MASDAVNNYITKRYNRWLDYSVYHCTHAGIADEAIDVLNEVLCSLLQKDNERLELLINTKKNGYSELDFFVLKMIKLNVCSPTSPYQNKYKPLPVDANIDYTRLEIEDTSEEVTDDSQVLLSMMNRVRDIFENLDLSPLAKSVFEYRFFNDEPFSEWPGDESLKVLYEIYNGVQDLIKKKLNGESIF